MFGEICNFCSMNCCILKAKYPFDSSLSDVSGSFLALFSEVSLFLSFGTLHERSTSGKAQWKSTSGKALQGVPGSGYWAFMLETKPQALVKTTKCGWSATVAKEN